MSFADDLTDDELIRIVQATDRITKPLSHRFEGDDDPIVDLMTKLGLGQNLVNKVMITGEVLRECAHRGLQIPRPNAPEPMSSKP